MTNTRITDGWPSTREQALEAALRLSLPNWFDTPDDITPAEVLVEYAEVIEAFLDRPNA